MLVSNLSVHGHQPFQAYFTRAWSAITVFIIIKLIVVYGSLTVLMITTNLVEEQRSTKPR